MKIRDTILRTGRSSMYLQISRVNESMRYMEIANQKLKAISCDLRINDYEKTVELDDIQRRGQFSLQKKQHLESIRMSVHQSNPYHLLIWRDEI